MAKIKIIIVIIFLLLIGLLYYSPAITSKNHYHITKSERNYLINNLKLNCNTEDVTYLISTYDDVLHDKNTSLCWSQYQKVCFYNKKNNLSLKIPIKCKVY